MKHVPKFKARTPLANSKAVIEELSGPKPFVVNGSVTQNLADVLPVPCLSLDKVDLLYLSAGEDSQVVSSPR